MKYKKLVVVLVLSVFTCLVIINGIYKKDDLFSASIAIGCDGQKYEKKLDEAYLTFEFSDKKIVKTIAISENKQEKISQENVKNIIGVQVIMNVPQKEIESYHLDTKDSNLAWLIFEEGMFDNYCEVVDVYFKSNSNSLK